MLPHFRFLLRFYLSLLLVFLAAKPVFMLYNGATARGVSCTDYADVLLHGLPLDLATAGYLSIAVWLLGLLTTWISLRAWRRIALGYFGLTAALLSLILLADTCLFAFWDIKLDGTVFNYLDSPQGAVASVSTGYMVGVTAAFLVLSVLLFLLLRATMPATLTPPRRLRTRWGATAAFVLVGGLLFLGIRGGVGKSTANVGMVYYSDRQFLNQSAVNPAFSIMASALKTKDFSRMHLYFPEEERAALFASLAYDTTSVTADTLLRMERPNVLLLLLEGCSAPFVEYFGGKPGITPHLNRLAREGVAFTRCYANSFRTDRGTVCTLSGYPAFPDVSVMKLANHTASLPSIARTLLQAGYQTEFLYGGDINFTNMNGYLLSTGYQRTYGDKDFPPEVRRTHDWGVTDSIAFDRLFELVSRYPSDRPWHTTFLTLASHEPWKVPYHRIEGDEKANAMAYLDHCIGRFVERFRQLPQWDRTLIVILPDHGINYPEGIPESDIRKYHIPLIWTGGAIRQPQVIDAICNQTDLAATLLGQLGLPHADFALSRDVTSATYTNPCAVHTWSGGTTFIDTTGVTVIDLVAQPQKVILDEPQPSARRADAANALLQTSYQLLSCQ